MTTLNLQSSVTAFLPPAVQMNGHKKEVVLICIKLQTTYTFLACVFILFLRVQLNLPPLKRVRNSQTTQVERANLVT